MAYRDYKKFDNIVFRHDIEKRNFNTGELGKFHGDCILYFW